MRRPPRQISPLIVRPHAAREEFKVKDAQKRTAFGGGRPAAVLEFEFLSREMVDEQSMGISAAEPCNIKEKSGLRIDASPRPDHRPSNCNI
jgi:hypothetical protein